MRGWGVTRAQDGFHVSAQLMIWTTDRPASTFPVLGKQVCTSTPGFYAVVDINPQVHRMLGKLFTN